MALLSVAVPASAATTAVRVAIEEVIEHGTVEGFAPLNYYSMTMGSTTYNYYGDGGVEVVIAVDNCYRFDKKLVLFLEDSDADGNVDRIAYGLEKFYCGDSKKLHSKLPGEVSDRLFKEALEELQPQKIEPISVSAE